MGQIGKADDEEEDESMKEYLLRTLNKTFIDNIPVDEVKELPPFYMYLVGSILEVGTLGLFIYLVYSGYVQGVNQQFMSLQSSSGICTPVLTPVTGSYYIDTQGLWETTAGFSYTKSLYKFEFTGFLGEYNTFYKLLNDTYNELVSYGHLHAANNDLAYNLVLWSFFTTKVPDPITGVPQSLILTGDTSVIFDRQSIYGLISNINGDCQSQSVAGFDPSDNLLTLQYSYSDFMSDPTCNTSVYPPHLGYQPTIDNDRFHLGLDVRALFLALAINLGVVQLDTLDIVYGQYGRTIESNGSTAYGNQYIDPLRPGMDPVYCIQYYPSPASNATDVCFLLMGNAVGMPIFNQNGYSTVEPSYCSCDVILDEANQNACSQFNLLPAIIFFNVPMSTSEAVLEESIFALLELRMQYATYDLSKEGYNASYAAGASTNINAERYMQTLQWRERAYAFCLTQDFGYCSLITWHVYDDLDQSISSYMYQLVNASCRDSIIMPYEDWSNLYNQPAPASLETGYYKCDPTKSSALMNSIGIASGNVGLFVPVMVVLMLPLIYTWLKFIGFVPPKEEYTEQELEVATSLLVTQVLRIRDGKTRGMQKMRFLQALTKELIQAATLAPGYPDSDDSESDEDEPQQDFSVGTGKARRRRSSTENSGGSAGSGGSPGRPELRKQISRRGSRFLGQDDNAGRPQSTRRASAKMSSQSQQQQPQQQRQRRHSDFDTTVSHARPTEAGMELGNTAIRTSTDSPIMNPIFASSGTADSDDEEGGHNVLGARGANEIDRDVL